jgi:hypothetical protein
MSDLTDLNLEDFHVYGVDPGHNHWVTAVDIEGHLGVNEYQNCVQFSNNEWYVKVGAIFRRKEQQEMKKDEGISAIESEIPSRKTANPDTFAYSSQYLFGQTNLSIYLTLMAKNTNIAFVMSKYKYKTSLNV